MGKTIRFNENGLIALKKKLNEIMVGTPGVSHNDVSANVKLYHGTDITALVTILKTNRMCASEGRQHGETHGLNWFTLKNDGTSYRGAILSIEIPESELDTVLQKMNNAHFISRKSCFDISKYNPKVERFCDHTREALNNYYRIVTEKGERYPIERMRDDIFYDWCERSGNEETFMEVSDYDFGIIMANVLGEDAVRKEGFIDEEVGEEFAPVTKIGGEEKNGDVVAGGNYFHEEQPVNEGYLRNKLSSIDLSEVGRVNYSFDFNEDDYREWLAENDLQDSEEARYQFYKDQWEFEVEYLDNDTYHHMESEYGLSYDDLEELFGERMADTIVKTCVTDGSGYFDTDDLYEDEQVDINNPQELDAFAMKLLRHGEYFKDCRGFILSNGVVIYTEMEHNEVLRIPGINNKFQFIELGNIRILPNSIDIGAEPTREQREVLKQVIASYSDDELYLDIFTPNNGEIGAKYFRADYRYVLGEIDRYYSEGIRPRGGSFDESKEKEGTLVEIKQAENEEIYSEAFKSWFGDWENVDADNFWYDEDVSKVVDNNLRPGIVKHGTPNKFDKFDAKMIGTTTDPGWLGTGFYFYGDNDIYAGQYAGRNGTVMECYLNIRNPYIAMGEDMERLSEANSKEASDEFREYLESEGYDGVYYNGDLNEEWVAFYPEQIRKVGSFGINENFEPEVASSEVDLSSFKKRDSLPPKIWKDEETLDSKVRLKLLDIADDFWEFVNLSWVEPKGIIITGSICNFNWSKFSDIDLHLIVDFSEIDSKTEFVKQYLDSKKNEWNTEHEGLKIMGFPVELYVQDISENPEAGGIYDLEENAWVRKPNPHTIKSIGLNKFNIKDKAAEIMTIIDDMYDMLSSTSDAHVLDQIGEDAHYLWTKVKDLRSKSLKKNGESGSGNIVYKVLRRTGYLDKLFKLFSTVYDRSNSITEGVNYDGDIFELAKKHFGTTHDIRECGYILPDGTMLDFSGRHTLKPGTDSSHLKGRRSVDHREIYEIGWDETGNVKNFDYTMEDFIKAGAVRVHVTSKYCSINLYKKPTSYQIPVLINIIQYAKGCVDVEIGDGDESLSYAEYDGVKARKPIADILRYFDEGINLVTESKEILNEFLEKDHNIFLYKYFQWAEKASDRDKVEDLFYHCPYIMSEYLSDVSGYDEELSNLEDELANDSDLEYDDEFIGRLLDALERHNLLRELLNNPYKYADVEELPAWFMMHFIRIVKNEWCIHFTEDADSIAKNGFTGGTEEIENLAYTGAGRQKRGEGYDFAFLLGDSGVDFNNYGSEAVIFRTSGVLLLHYGDEQRQVVFWGPNVKSFIPVVRNYGDWVVYGNKGQILMSTSNPSEIADWATNNLPQYRKQIMTGKNGYIPKRSIFDKEKNKYVREPYPIYKNESVKKYLTLLKEEVALDGSTEDNPYEKRWKAEREALKNFIANYGKLMQSREDNKGGKLYKVYYDETMSNLIGYNYCICVQWNEQEMKPGSTVYIRALDKFTPFIRRNLQFDTRGRDNMRGTYDDTRY